jgi:hypothetical protein
MGTRARTDRAPIAVSHPWARATRASNKEPDILICTAVTAESSRPRAEQIGGYLRTHPDQVRSLNVIWGLAQRAALSADTRVIISAYWIEKRSEDHPCILRYTSEGLERSSITRITPNLHGGGQACLAWLAGAYGPVLRAVAASTGFRRRRPAEDEVYSGTGVFSNRSDNNIWWRTGSGTSTCCIPISSTPLT